MLVEDKETEGECVRCGAGFSAYAGWQYCPMCGQQHWIERSIEDIAEREFAAVMNQGEQARED